MSCAFSSGPSFQRSQLVCSKRSLALLAADCLALFGTMFLIGVIRVLLGGEISLSQHVPLALFLLVVPVVNAFEGLYSGVPPALPEEMRLLGISTSIAYFSIAIFLFLGRGDLPSRTVYVLVFEPRDGSFGPLRIAFPFLPGGMVESAHSGVWRGRACSSRNGVS